jgi:hypothetical protein
MTLISLRMRREAEDDWGKKRSRTWLDKSEAYPCRTLFQNALGIETDDVATTISLNQTTGQWIAISIIGDWLKAEAQFLA